MPNKHIDTAGTAAHTDAAEAGKKSDTAPRYTREQLLQSRRYSVHRDLLAALLRVDGTYTHPEVEKIIQDFLKGEVK